MYVMYMWSSGSTSCVPLGVRNCASAIAQAGNTGRNTPTLVDRTTILPLSQDANCYPLYVFLVPPAPFWQTICLSEGRACLLGSLPCVSPSLPSLFFWSRQPFS